MQSGSPRKCLSCSKVLKNQDLKTCGKECRRNFTQQKRLASKRFSFLRVCKCSRTFVSCSHKNKYCSSDCRKWFNQKEIICPFCNQTKRVKRNSLGKYCYDCKKAGVAACHGKPDSEKRTRSRRKRKPYIGLAAGNAIKEFASPSKSTCTTCRASFDENGFSRCPNCSLCSQCNVVMITEKGKQFCRSCTKEKKRQRKQKERFLGPHPNYKRRAKSIGVPSDQFSRRLILSLFQYRCEKCGVGCDGDALKDNSPEIDHIVPWGMMKRYGVGNTLDNVRLLCRKCNIAKSDRLPNGEFRSALDVIKGYPARPLTITEGAQG